MATSTSFIRTTRLVAENGLYLPPPGTGGGGGGITQLTGDVLAGPALGSTPATVVRLNGATVPAAGALTPGNVLTVTGASALAYLPPAVTGITQLTGQVTAGPGTGPLVATVAAPEPNTLYVSPSSGSDVTGNGNLFNPFATYAHAAAVATAPSLTNLWNVVLLSNTAENIAIQPFVNIAGADPSGSIVVSGTLGVGAGYTGVSALQSSVSNLTFTGVINLNFAAAAPANTAVTLSNITVNTGVQVEGIGLGTKMRFVSCDVNVTADMDSCLIYSQETAWEGAYVQTASVAASALEAYGGTFTAGIEMVSDPFSCVADVVAEVIGDVVVNGPSASYASSVDGIGTGIILLNGAAQPIVQGSGNALAGYTLVADGTGRWVLGYPTPSHFISPWTVLAKDGETTLVTITPPLADGEIIDVSIIGNMSIVGGPTTTGSACFSRRFYGVQNVSGTLAGPTGETTDVPNVANDIGASLAGATMNIAIAGTSLIIEASRPPGVAVYAGVTVDYVRGVPSASGVTSVSPNILFITQGSPTTITVNLSSGGTGATGISIDGQVLTSIHVVSDTEVTGVLAAGTYPAGTGNVVVTSPSSPAPLVNGFTFSAVLAPTLAAITSPLLASANGGQVFTLNGTNLTGVTGVTVDGVPATGVSSTATTVTFTTPIVSESTTTTGYNVAVSTAGGTATLSAWGTGGPGAIYILDGGFTNAWYAAQYNNIADTWTDLVGGVVASVPGGFGATAPTLTTSGFSGLGGPQPIVTFAITSALQNVAVPGPIVQPFSVFASCDATNAGNYEIVWAAGTSTVVAGVVVVTTRNNWIQAPGNGSQTTYSITGTPTENEWFVEGASSTVNQNNGVAAATANPGANAMTGVTFGNYYNSTADGLQGDIQLFGIYPGTPSVAARANFAIISEAIGGT